MGGGGGVAQNSSRGAIWKNKLYRFWGPRFSDFGSHAEASCRFLDSSVIGEYLVEPSSPQSEKHPHKDGQAMLEESQQSGQSA